MENTLRKKLISKTLSKKFLYDKEGVRQEELIQKWKYPELSGYEGLLSFNSLVYNAYETIETDDFKKLSKNIEAKKELSTDYHLDILKEDNGKLSLLSNCELHNYFHGENNISIRDMAKKYRVSKSYLSSIISNIKKKL